MLTKILTACALVLSLSACLATTPGGIPVIDSSLANNLRGCGNLNGNKSQLDAMLAAGRYADCLNNGSAALYR